MKMIRKVDIVSSTSLSWSRSICLSRYYFWSESWSGSWYWSESWSKSWFAGWF